MRPVDIQLGNDVDQKLTTFTNTMPMPGINDPIVRACLIEQIIDSVRRIRYVTLIKNKVHSTQVADATNIAFDPIKAAAFHLQNGNIEESCWLIFLATHFGKNSRTKWQLVKNVYGAMGQPAYWTWARITGDVSGFRSWLDANSVNVKQNGKFGNHHKFQSINAYENNGTGNSIATYVDWILSDGNHVQKFTNILLANGSDPRQTFAAIYKSMNAVANFGRTTRFDYVTMIGKFGIVNMEPDSTYMIGATGPYQGAALLFGVSPNRKTFNLWLDGLEAHLGLYYGMQVLEDALCNWQKSPGKYVYFGG